MAEPKPVADDELSFPVPIGTILGLARLTEHALDEVGLTLPQYRLLGFCAIGPRTPSEVAIRLSVCKQSVTASSMRWSGPACSNAPSIPSTAAACSTARPRRQDVLDRGQAAVDGYLALVLDTLEPAERDVVRRGMVAAGHALNRAWNLTRTPTTIPPTPSGAPDARIGGAAARDRAIEAARTPPVRCPVRQGGVGV